MIELYKRNRNPHWQSAHATYFVTFNLFDAIPSQVGEKLRIERQIRIAELERLRERATAAEIAAIDAVIRERAEAALDASHGSCFMNDPRVADLVAQAITFLDGTRYELHAWCVMPNHVHTVFETEQQIAGIVHSWKSYSAKEANKLLRRTGEFWQEDYRDTIMRNEKHMANTIQYVLDNPLKAGLKNWRWVGTRACPPQLPVVPAGD